MAWWMCCLLSAPAEAAIGELWARLTPAGQALVGVPLAQLQPAGHELARALLQPLATQRGPLSAAEVTAETTAKLAGYGSQRDGLLRHRVSLLGGYPVQDLGDPIDWFRAPEDDWQWPTHLSRHYWLRPLAVLYRAKGDQEAAAKVVAVLLDWTAKFPLGSEQLAQTGRKTAEDGLPICEGPFKGYVDGPWTSLSAHARVSTWSQLLQLVWDCDALDNQATATLLNSLCGDHLRSMLAYPRAMNQYQGIAFSLIELGSYYPWFTGAEQARRVGWERMTRYATTELYPDGSIAECSPNYGGGCVARLHGLLQTTRAHHEPVPEPLAERVRLAMRYLALSSDPAGRSPRLAKGGGSVRGLVGSLNTATGDPEVAWVASAGQQGRAPAATCYLFPWAGHAVLRSGWDADATWLLFEPGPRGSGHHDLAQLNLQLIARGEWLLTDPGYYSYSSSGEAGAMAAWLRSTAAHNCALVDGEGQIEVAPGGRRGPNAAPGTYRWDETPTAVTVDGLYTYGFGPQGRIAVTHRRTITFARAGDLVRVEDRFEGAGQHQLELRWQFPPRAIVTVEGNALRATGTKARLVLVPSAATTVVTSLVKGRRDPLGGWFSDHYGHLEPTTMGIMATHGELPLTLVTELRVGAVP